QRVVRLPFQRQVGGDLVGAHGRLVVAIAGGRIGIVIRDIATLVADLGGSAEEQVVGDGNVDRPAQLGAAIIAQGGVDIAAEFTVGLARAVQDGAAGGVAADQGTLGALQHFHAVDVEK